MVNFLRRVAPAVGVAVELASAAAAARDAGDWKTSNGGGNIGTLQIGSLCRFSEAYADHGTGSAMDLSMFEPDDHCDASKQREWYEVGHFGISGCVRVCVCACLRV